MNQSAIDRVSNQDRDPEISIIVPVYNVEKYLPQALDAILKQTFSDWECILVNDGSTDASGTICDEFGGKDHRFIVAHKDNGGVSSARNVALEMAKGRFVSFIDSDDWPEPCFLEVMHNLMINHNVDLVQCGFKRAFKFFEREKPLVEKKMILERDEAMLTLLNNSVMPCFLWNKLFRREIISEPFPLNKNYEDAYTLPHWLQKASKVVLSPNIVYNYRMRRGSICNSEMARNQYDFFVSSRHLADLVKKTVPESFTPEKYKCYLLKVIVSAAKKIARNEADKTIRRETLKKFSCEIREIGIPLTSELKNKQRFRANCLKENPWLFEKLMCGVNKFDLHSRFQRKHLFE